MGLLGNVDIKRYIIYTNQTNIKPEMAGTFHNSGNAAKINEKAWKIHNLCHHGQFKVSWFDRKPGYPNIFFSIFILEMFIYILEQKSQFCLRSLITLNTHYSGKLAFSYSFQ